MVNMDTPATPTFKEARDNWARAYFSALFSEAGGNISEVARRAGLERSHVRTYLRRFGLLGSAQPQARAA